MIDRIHPALTGAPLAFLVLLAVLEFVTVFPQWSDEKRRTIAATQGVLVIALLVITPLTFLSGYLAAENASQTFQVDAGIIAAHEAMGRALLIAIVILSLLFLTAQRAMHNKIVFRSVYRVALAATLVLGILTGYRGGELVFAHGAGVFIPESTVPSPAGR